MVSDGLRDELGQAQDEVDVESSNNTIRLCVRGRRDAKALCSGTRVRQEE